jgi:hypothetical protein
MVIVDIAGIKGKTLQNCVTKVENKEKPVNIFAYLIHCDLNIISVYIVNYFLLTL